MLAQVSWCCTIIFYIIIFFISMRDISFSSTSEILYTPFVWNPREIRMWTHGQSSKEIWEEHVCFFYIVLLLSYFVVLLFIAHVISVNLLQVSETKQIFFLAQRKWSFSLFTFYFFTFCTIHNSSSLIYSLCFNSYPSKIL